MYTDPTGLAWYNDWGDFVDAINPFDNWIDNRQKRDDLRFRAQLERDCIPQEAAWIAAGRPEDDSRWLSPGCYAYLGYADEFWANSNNPTYVFMPSVPRRDLSIDLSGIDPDYDPYAFNVQDCRAGAADAVPFLAFDGASKGAELSKWDKAAKGLKSIGAAVTGIQFAKSITDPTTENWCNTFTGGAGALLLG